MYRNIPQELRSTPHWVVWRYEETQSAKPTKVPYSPSHFQTRANVNDPNTFGTFEQAIEAAQAGWFSGIGFVLTQNDPFALIDLDDTEGDAKLYETQLEIYRRLGSYTELSPSGNGVHVIVKGALPAGRKRNRVELYSSGRFMTMTGNFLEGSNPAIEDRHDHINELYTLLGGKEEKGFYDGNDPQTKSDEEVIDIASNAENGAKFLALHSGDWTGYYPSQSEADLAYVNIIAFYTQNREQIARMFRCSQLGARDKQTSIRGVDYVNYMINKSFDRILPPVDTSALLNRLNDALASSRVQVEQEAAAVPEVHHIPDSQADSTYPVPPGLLGEIAQFIYAQAPRQVAEIALSGAIGLMAGICGRAYNVSNTGLNQYIMLLAPTGTGKEAIAKGIEKLMGQVQRTVPAASDFIGPAEVASPQALIKYMSKGPTSFVSVVGEIGIALQQMTDPRAPSHLVGLRRLLLDLFNKSGEGSILRPTIYSDKEKNTTSVQAPSYTMLGESTPERFYEFLDEMMISEGLLPRFTIIEYRGPRPPMNKGHAFVNPSNELVERMSQLCAQALMLNNSHKAVHIRITPEANQMFDAFNIECDARINNATREVTRHLWNRAHIKAMKLAGLVAVGCDPYNPTITPDSAAWAIRIVEADSNNLLGRFNAGEVGQNSSEVKQISELVRIVKEYITKPWSEIASYGGSAMMHGERIIPWAYMQRKLANVSAFKGERIPASDVIRRTVKLLLERGDLAEVGKGQLIERFSFRGNAYMVAAPRAFGL
uniref:Replicative primase/helicase n=1 Tax=Pseudomonas phage Pavpe01 TaxID=3138545 RepID=A0AAU6VZW1_9VIRU